MRTKIGPFKKGIQHIPYLDLRVKDPSLKQGLLAAVEKVLDHGRFILGPEHEEFERQIALFCGKKYAAGIGSGTLALYLALRALDLSAGDEVITTPLSWIATLNAIVLAGATPVFVDIRKDLNLNPDLIEEAINERTKAIVPVHFSGRLCDMAKIMSVAGRYGIAVVEDAAQAFGAHLNGKMAGSFGTINCFSMNPMKVYGAYGEAGAILTDDLNLYEKVISLRYNGTINKEECIYPSLNGRLDTIQAAMLLVNLKYFQQRIERRREIAAIYREQLGDLVTCPDELEGSFHVYYTFTVLTEERNRLREFLRSRGIETKIHHPILMPHQKAYHYLKRPSVPLAEQFVNQILSLPNHQDLTHEMIDYVITNVKEFFGA